jgi:ubiquitin carboxyl-terminal hydrolase L5
VDWLEAVAPEIQARIARYSANEIRFNLMAVVADRQEQLSKQLTAVRARRQAAAAKLGLSDGGDAGAMDVDEPGSSSAAVQELPSDEEALQHVLAEAEGEIGR